MFDEKWLNQQIEVMNLKLKDIQSEGNKIVDRFVAKRDQYNNEAVNKGRKLNKFIPVMKISVRQKEVNGYFYFEWFKTNFQKRKNQKSMPKYEYIKRDCKRDNFRYTEKQLKSYCADGYEIEMVLETEEELIEVRKATAKILQIRKIFKEYLKELETV